MIDFKKKERRFLKMNQLAYSDQLRLIRENPQNFYQMECKDNRLYLELIKIDGHYIKEVYQPSFELIYEVIQTDVDAFHYVRAFDEELLMFALQKRPFPLTMISDVNPELRHWIDHLKGIKRQFIVEPIEGFERLSLDEKKEKLKENGLLLKYLPLDEQTEEICRLSIKENINALLFAEYRTYQAFRCGIQLNPDLKFFSPYELDQFLFTCGKTFKFDMYRK